MLTLKNRRRGKVLGKDIKVGDILLGRHTFEVIGIYYYEGVRILNIRSKAGNTFETYISDRKEREIIPAPRKKLKF